MAPLGANLISRIKWSKENCTATRQQLKHLSGVWGLTLITLAHMLSAETSNKYMNAKTIVMRKRIQNHSQWNMSVLCRFGRIAAGYITSTNGPRARFAESLMSILLMEIFAFQNRDSKFNGTLFVADILIERTLSHFVKKNSTNHHQLCSSFFLFASST